MPITANCTGCGSAIKAPDNAAGKKVKCPKCATVMVLPAAAVGEAIQATPRPAAPPPAPPRAAPPPTPAAPPPIQQSVRAAREDSDEDERHDDRDDRDDREDLDDRDIRRRGSRVGGEGGTNGLAIAGMVLGIVGFAVVFIPCIGWLLAIILGIVGATLSGIGLASAGKLGSGKGMAIAGLVLSIIAIIWVPIWIFIIVGSTVTAANQAIQQAAKNNQIIFQDKGIVIKPGMPIQPGAVQGPPAPATGKVTLAMGRGEVQGNLQPNDPRDRSRPASVCKVFTIDMVAGKTYQIDMTKAAQGLDPYLRLEDAAGNNLADDDDGGGGNLNARLLFVCAQTGEHRIVATTFLGGTGNFTLQVSEK